MLAAAAGGVRARSFAADGHAADFDPYPADRVNVSEAVQLDFLDGLSRFSCGKRWLSAEQQLRSKRGYEFTSPATMAFLYAAASFRVCSERLEGCRVGYLDSLSHVLLRSGGSDAACVAKGIYLTVERYLARTDWKPERLEYIKQLQQVAVRSLSQAHLTLASVPSTGVCTAEGELLLLRDCINSLEERYLPQRELFRLLALSSPNAFSPRPSDVHDLAFARPSFQFGKCGFEYTSASGTRDNGFHLLVPSSQQLEAVLAGTPAAHSEDRDIFEIAHSCLPVDAGVARMRRSAAGAATSYFCAWRRQHDANPARVEIYSGWLNEQLRPDGAPSRLTPGDDARLFAHAGRVHAVYNDAWVGDEAGVLSGEFPVHHSRHETPAKSTATVSVWLARFHVPALTGWEGTDAEPPPSALSPAELRSPLVFDGRVQLVPPPELRAVNFASSADVFPFGKNYMPFSHEGSLHFIYSLAPLAIIECPDLSALDLPPSIAGGADEAPSEPLPAGVARRPRHVSICRWSSLQPSTTAFDPRGMGGLRGSTPAHVLPGGVLVGLGHLRFNHMVATPFAFSLDLARLEQADGGLKLAYPDPDAYASPIEWLGSAMPAREANPVNLFYESDGTARLLVSLKRGTDFMIGSDQQLTFQTVLVNVSSAILAAAPDVTASAAERGPERAAGDASGKSEL